MKLLNYRFSQKLKLLGNGSGAQYVVMGGRVESEIKLKISCSDTMLNYRFSQKFKLLGNCEFKHLTIVLTKEINILRYKK